MFPKKIECDGEKYQISKYNKVIDLIYKEPSSYENVEMSILYNVLNQNGKHIK